MDCMIAFDVGGTKTDAVLFDCTGKVLRHSITPGANPLDVGFDEACRRYMHAINCLLEGIDDVHLISIYGAIACLEYFGKRVTEVISSQVEAEHIRTEPDGNCLISAMLGHTDGACLICGTGSSLCYRRGESYGHIGGWGYLVDSCASGFILGKKALLAVAREQDGRGEKTLLTDLIARECKEPMTEHFEKIYAGGRPYIASFARLVFEARREGDAVAARIFDDCVADLTELIWTAFRKFGGGYSLVLNGGIFQHFPEYVQAVKAHAPMQVEMIDSDAPPVYGGAVEAMYDAGLTADDAFKQRFLEGYRQKI